MALTKIDDRGITYPLDLIDNEKIRLGTGNDLEIYHDGSHSYIKDSGTGELRLASSQFTVQNAASNETLLYAVENGSVGLKYDDSLKAETYSNGFKINGQLQCEGDVKFDNPDNAGRDVRWDSSDDTLEFSDNTKAGFGNDLDLKIYHDGTDSYIDNSTNELIVKTGSNFVVKVTDGAEKTIKGITNGAVELYYDNSKKFETTSYGASMDGLLNFNNSGDKILLPDSGKIILGASSDLQIYHDGGNSWVKDAGTGALYLDGSAIKITHGGATETLAAFYENGAAELWYDGVKTFETTTDGVTVKGSEGGSAFLYVSADEGDDNADKWRHIATVGGQYFLSNYASGGWEHNIGFTGNGSTELYYDNSKKIETNAQGIIVGGDVDNSTSTQGVALQTGGKIRSRVADTSATAFVVSIEDSGASKVIINGAGNGYFVGGLDIPDSANIQLGDGDDLQIWHDGSESWL